MDVNPHTLNTILTRIREQMRCPQCGTAITVDFPSIKLAGDDFLVLQLKCDGCNAFIVLHVNIAEAARKITEEQALLTKNASSNLLLDEEEMKMLCKALDDSGGSFKKLFEQHGSFGGKAIV